MARRTIRLAEWGKARGMSRLATWRHAQEGKVPGVFRTPTGRWMVEVEEPEPVRGAALYARVSAHDQKADLDRQIARLSKFAAQNGFTITQVVTEIGSGLNGRRRELAKLLADPSVGTILVEHRDRLARFGVEHLEKALGASGRSIVVADPGEAEDDLVRDMIDLMACFSARLYGRRSARNRARRALEALKP